MISASAVRARRLWATALLAAVGCSDPSAAPLPGGKTVILSDGSDAPVRAWVVPAGPVPPGEERRLHLAARTRAVVVRDDPVEAPREPSFRLIRVRILDGPEAGTEIEVGRYKLQARR